MKFPAYVAAGFPTAAASSEMANLPFLQFQPVPQGITSCELHMPIDPPQSALQMTTSSSTSVPEMFTNSTSFSVISVTPNGFFHSSNIFDWCYAVVWWFYLMLIIFALQQVQPFTTWDTDLQSLYTGEFQWGRSTTFSAPLSTTTHEDRHSLIHGC